MCPIHCIAEVYLAVHIVFPRRGVAVFQVGHENLCTRVKGVDDHLAVNWASDFHPSVEQVSGQ